MANFVYRLETLLTQKRDAKAAAERALAACRAEEREARARLVELEAESARALDRKRIARETAFVDGDPIEDILARRNDVEIFHRRWEDAKGAVFSQQLFVEELAEATANAVAALTEVSREVEVLVKHRAKAAGRFAAEQDRKETLEQEEIASGMFQNRRRS